MSFRRWSVPLAVAISLFGTFVAPASANAQEHGVGESKASSDRILSMIIDASLANRTGRRKIVNPEWAQVHAWGLEITNGECDKDRNWWRYRENGRAHEHWLEGTTCGNVSGIGVWKRKWRFNVHYFARLRERLRTKIVPGLEVSGVEFGSLNWAWSNGKKAVLEFDLGNGDYDYDAHYARELRITGNAALVTKWWQ